MRAGPVAAKDQAIRVMSFNIRHGVGADGRLDLERVADVAATEGADVVGLQEVDRYWSKRSDFVDQGSWLASGLDMHVVYGANLDRAPPAPGAPRRQCGTAILSTAPILDWDNTFLPGRRGHERRGLLRARLVVRGVPLLVYNTHLQHNDAAARLEQAAAIKSMIAAPKEPVVLLGDLNAAPGSPEIETLAHGLVDAWERVGPGNGYTFPGVRPRRRIDYVLTSPDLVARSAAVVTSGASDHLPVRADITVDV